MLPQLPLARPVYRAMRRLVFALLLGSAALAAPAAHGQAIRLTAERTPLDAVLHQLASQTGLDIVYAHRLVEGRAVTGRYLGDDPEQALATVLRGSGLRVERLRPGQYVIVGAYPTPGLQPVSYRGTLSGTVADAETSELLPGAHVLLVGLQLGAVTNPAGYFALPDLPAGSYRIRVSYVGYRAVEQEVEVYPESPALPPTIRLSPQMLSSGGEAVVEGSEAERSDLQPVPGSDALDIRQAASIPAFLGESDLFGALEWLPGVGRAGEAGGELVIRGSEAHFNRYLLDGAPIIHPWHTFGLFSTFQTEALKSVRLYKGSFPAEYGGGLSAVLDVEMRDGDRDKAAGTVALSPVSLRAVSEVPLGRGASLMLSGRRTYLDLLLSPQLQPAAAAFASDEAGSGAQQDLGYYFFDVGAKVTLRPSPFHRVSLSVYEGGDDLSADVPFVSLLDPATADAANPLGARLRYGWGNRVVSARYRWLASRRLFLTTTGYYSRYRAEEAAFAQPTAASSVDSDYRVRFAETGATVDADYYYSLEHQLRAGLRLVGRTFESTLEETVLRSAMGEETRAERDAVRAVEAVAYVQDTWQPSARWQVQPGVRVEAFGLGPYVSISPRLNVRYVVARERVFLKAGLSRQVQYLHRLRDRYSFTLRPRLEPVGPGERGGPPGRRLAGRRRARSHAGRALRRPRRLRSAPRRYPPPARRVPGQGRDRGAGDPAGRAPGAVRRRVGPRVRGRGLGTGRAWGVAARAVVRLRPVPGAPAGRGLPPRRLRRAAHAQGPRAGEPPALEHLARSDGSERLPGHGPRRALRRRRPPRCRADALPRPAPRQQWPPPGLRPARPRRWLRLPGARAGVGREPASLQPPQPPQHGRAALRADSPGRGGDRRARPPDPPDGQPEDAMVSRRAERLGRVGAWGAMLTLALAGCDLAEPEPAQLVVEAFAEAGEALPTVTVRQTVGIELAENAAGVGDAAVTLTVGGDTVAYHAVPGAVGQYEPLAQRTAESGERVSVEVVGLGQRARASSRVPDPIMLDSVRIVPAAAPVEAVFADSLGFEVREGFVYPITVTLYWQAPAADTAWVRTRLAPPAAFPSAVVDFLLSTDAVQREADLTIGDGRRAWSGVYAVPVTSRDAPLPAHDLGVALVRSGTDYARYALSRTDPDRREPIGNVEGGLGIAVAVAVDRQTVRVGE